MLFYNCHTACLHPLLDWDIQISKHFYTTVIFLNIEVGHRSPGMFSIFLHQRWGGGFAINTRVISAYCIPQLMIPWKPSLILPAQASPTSLQQACFLGHTVHPPGVAYNLEGQLQLFQTLSQMSATLRWLNLLSSLEEAFFFLFQVPLFSLLFWGLSKSHSRTTKDSFHSSNNPTLNTKPQDRNSVLAVQFHVGSTIYSAKFPEMTCSLGEKYISRHASRYHTHFQKTVSQSPWNFWNIKKGSYILTSYTPVYLYLSQWEWLKFADRCKKYQRITRMCQV